MTEINEDKLEKRIRFVAKHYTDGAMDTSKAWAKFAEKNAVKRSLPLLRYWQSIAAVALVCFAVGTWYIFNENDSLITITTEAGQVKNIYLPDNTLIAMAENSTVIYDSEIYGKGQRDVEMKGKAFFQVQRDERAPFSVKTTATKVVVLGTSFQLKENNGETELYVASGKVDFSSIGGNEGAVILTEGMSAIYNDISKAANVVDIKSSNALSWRTKILHFDNTPIDRVIKDIEEYYSVSIVNNTVMVDKALTASFSDLPLEEVLIVVNETLDIHLTIKPNHK
jgi:Fe2+-dicitrate sensor, membrane component